MKRNAWLYFQMVALAAALVVFFVPGAMATEKWSFELGAEGGLNFWNLGDLDGSGETIKFEASQDPNERASIEELTTSLLAGIEGRAYYELPSEHWVGLGVGLKFFPGARYKQVHTKDISTNEVQTVTLDLSAQVIPVTLYYRVPWKSDITADWAERAHGYLGIGPSFYSTSIGVDDTTTETAMQPKFDRGDLEDSGVGFHVVGGASYALTESLSMELGLGYSIANLDSFQGSLVDDGGTATNKRLIMDKDVTTGRETLDIKDSSLALASNERALEMRMGGLQVALSVRYRF